MSYENTGRALPYNENGKTGLLLKGDEYVHVDGLLTTKTPLLTEAQDVAGAINELFTGGGGGGEEWQPDPSWPEVPEPGANEVTGLVYVGEFDNNVLSGNDTAELGSHTLSGESIMSWGDGTSDTIAADGEGITNHGYATGGFFVFKHTSEARKYYAPRTTGKILIIKYGENRYLYHDPPLSSFRETQYISFLGSNLPQIFRCHWDVNNQFYNYMSPFGWFDNLPSTRYSTVFQGCYALQKFECKTPIVNIPCNFMTSTSLRYFDSPDIAVISDLAFDGAHKLDSIFAPNCSLIGGYVFNTCYALREVTLADNCTFGPNPFNSCDSLIIRPDGSF